MIFNSIKYSSYLARTLAVALVLMMGGAACRKTYDQGSDTKTLDQLAYGKQGEQNRCGYDVPDDHQARSIDTQWLDAISAPSEALKNVAALVLKAVPKGLAQTFFASGGRISIVENAVELCAESLSEAERQFLGAEQPRIQACWRQVKRSQPPQIILAASESVIHHSLLRMMAYVFSDFFVTRAAQSQASLFQTQQWSQALGDFQAAQRELASAFLADIDTSDTQADLAHLEQFHGSEPDRFAAFVTAEAIDSYYCSKQSRALFEREFTSTWSSFIGGSTKESFLANFARLVGD